MSMPNIPDINPNISISKEEALQMILSSIGMEELSLAHILNAEAEKIQFSLGTLEGSCHQPCDMNTVLTVNHSSARVLRDVIKNEILLLMKLEDITELIPQEPIYPPYPPCPPYPPYPSYPPCQPTYPPCSTDCPNQSGQPYPPYNPYPPCNPSQSCPPPSADNCQQNNNATTKNTDSQAHEEKVFECKKSTPYKTQPTGDGTLNCYDCQN